MATLIGSFVPGSEEWHAARAHGIGGSEVAAVLGLSPWESRFSLWHRKAKNLRPIDESPEMEWGKRLESVVLAKYIERHPELEYDPDAVRGTTWCHDDRPWQIANPDLLATRRVIEAKTSRFGDEWGPDGSDEPDAVPIYYRTQGIWYGDTLDIDVVDFCVLIGGSDYREYSITWTADEAAELRAACEEFLAELDAGVRPDIDGHTATYQVIRELHPDIDDVEVQIDGDLAQRYVLARHLSAEATTAEQLAKSEIADAMGTARKAKWDGFTIVTRQARGDGDPFLVAGRKLPSVTLPSEAA